MCGIFGFFDRKQGSVPKGLAERMGISLRHRGPDDDGVFKRPGVMLGNRRLAIIDVAGGHQPFVSASGAIVVVQNGEIFNHVELATELKAKGYPCQTHSDTEVLLRLYELEGIDFVKRLNGMFAVAIYDARESALYLVRDRVGVKPLYVHDDGERLLFGSEIKAILEGGVERRIDVKALDLYLAYNFVPPPRTLFAGVQHVLPGHWLRIDRHGTSVRRWWHLDNRVEDKRSDDDWMQEFNTILDDAVRLRLRADVPFGAFLSGGVDSSTVVGMMTRHVAQPVKTFSIGFEDPQYDESRFAEVAARRFATDHICETVVPDMLDLWPLTTYHCDQPHGDASFMPTLRVAQLASKHVKVVLTGDGADELFAGYEKYVRFFSRDLSGMDDHTFRTTYAESLMVFGDAARKTLYLPAFGSRVADFNAVQEINPILDEVSALDRINQALYLDLLWLLPGNNLVKPDRMGMAVSLEARTPFLDYRMIEFAFKMPGQLKLRNGETKFLYKRAVEKLIGSDLAHRAKQMFTVPIGDWFRGVHSNYCAELLLGPDSLAPDLFKADALRAMINSHQCGRNNHTRELRVIVALELWLRRFHPTVA